MTYDDQLLEEMIVEIRKLAQWSLCMSYNDSYFGEPAGLVKQAVKQLERLADKAEGQS
jgi:hypothetical protein